MLTIDTTSHSQQVALAAAVAVAEAGGEQEQGLAAVCEVIRNRVGKRWPNLAAVVTARMQFSCLNGLDDIARFIVERCAHPKYGRAVEILSGPQTDLVHGATHYCRVDCNPPWAAGVQPIAVVGNHKFFKVD